MTFSRGTVTDKDGVWEVQTDKDGKEICRILAEPAPEFVAALEKEVKDKALTSARAVVDRVTALERATVEELRGAVVEIMKERLNYASAVALVSTGTMAEKVR